MQFFQCMTMECFSTDPWLHFLCSVTHSLLCALHFHVFAEICTWVCCSFWCPCGWDCSLNFSFWCFIVGAVNFDFYVLFSYYAALLNSFVTTVYFDDLIGEKLELKNPTLSIITQVICNTQGILAPNIIFPWWLLVMCGWVCASVVSNSLPPYGRWPTRLVGPWGFSRQTVEVGCRTLLHRIFLSQGLNLHLFVWSSLPNCSFGNVLSGLKSTIVGMFGLQKLANITNKAFWWVCMWLICPTLPVHHWIWALW